MTDHIGKPKYRTIQDIDTSGQEWGSDFIADLLKAYGFEYISFNPGASFRGIEESIINYNDNDPKVIQVGHEALSVSIAHGYAKATNEPALCILHNVVGTMHGAMSLYNAYVDRIPIIALSGTGPMRKSKRRPWIDWIHTALVQGNIVREYVKWDDQPTHVDGAAESLIRAHKIADTVPKGPVYITYDHDIQECALDKPIEIPNLKKFDTPTKMAPDPDAIEAAADMLVEADLPVVLTDTVGDSREAVNALVELCELLGMPVIDHRRRRYNFPNTHPLELGETDVYRDADVVLGLDMWSLNYVLQNSDSITHELSEAIDEEFSLINIGSHELNASSLTADYYSLRETDLSIMAATDLAIPSLIKAVRERFKDDNDARGRANTRFEELAEQHERRNQEWKKEAADVWNETPISTARLAGEVWNLIEDEEWVLVNGQLRGWSHRLWEIDEFDKYIGGDSGGGGVGYGVGAAIGGALAYSSTNRIPINLQPDGDLMFYLCGLWTMGHYEIPMLTVVHNNQSLYNSTQHRMGLAEYRGRDDSYKKALIGTGIWDPVPDYAQIAESMGVNGYGPIEDPDEIASALKAALDDVKGGKPALVDVVCQVR